MVRNLTRVCVFCGSNPGSDPRFAGAARDLGTALATRGIELVYGGGQVGLMGILADAALAAGGRVIGVIPHALDRLEVAHKRLSELRHVDTMHERKALMVELSDAFVALPGGFGTLDELCEVLTWQQLGIHAKPVALLEVAGYFAHFRAFLDHATASGFLSAETRGLLHVADAPDSLLDLLRDVAVPPRPRWLSRRHS